MGNRKMILNATLFLLVIFIIMSFTVFADEIEKTIEQKKAVIIKIMSAVELKLSKYYKEFGYDLNFCTAFLKNFKEQKGIEHIKPILETDDYNDPKLQAYLSKCPKISLNKKVTYVPRIWEMIKELPEEEQEQYGHVYYATKGFKLYKVNIDNSEKNGDEYVLYSEGFYEEKLKRFDDKGKYSIAYLETCEVKGGVGTWAQFNYEKKKQIENYNGILRYKGKIYVFDLNEWAGNIPGLRYLDLWEFDKKQENMVKVCSFS